LIEIGHQPEETTEGTTEATTLGDDKTPITTKEIACKTVFKEMLLQQQTNQMPVFNVEKWDTTPGIAQNATQAISTTEQPT